MARIAVIYYSATGNVHMLAEGIAEGASEGGADVRLRRVAELESVAHGLTRHEFNRRTPLAGRAAEWRVRSLVRATFSFSV